ncbi:hypothetical protein RJ639_036374 [Escallonia herrerae]|uniref:Uncharacterized protein n=1 Tax=Escallonia herrerae TaxID=1293975 RepID=A0AA89B7Z2_9ASTE|nr:hypothetical protein RJ639_036374 [Escallonia herrerae]
MGDGCMRVLVEAIHSAPSQAVLYISGGASQTLGWLMSVPGASNTVLEAVIPYSRMSMIQLLGKVPVQFTSRKHAEDMALAAYNRALKVLGVGFTGSLASTHPKLGEHRFHLSTRTSDRLYVCTVTLSKNLHLELLVEVLREVMFSIIIPGFTDSRGGRKSFKPVFTRDSMHSSSKRVPSTYYDGHSHGILLNKSRAWELIVMKAGFPDVDTKNKKWFKTSRPNYAREYQRNMGPEKVHGRISVECSIGCEAIANACNVQASFSSQLTDTDVADDCEEHFHEDQELEQLISGKICFKVYPFSSGMMHICHLRNEKSFFRVHLIPYMMVI